MSVLERIVFSELRTILKDNLDKIVVSNDMFNKEPAFPAVLIREEASHNHIQSQDSGSGENNNNVVYDINIYSNKTNGRKKETDDIFNIINKYMVFNGFTRISKASFPEKNNSLFRVVSRYAAVVSADEAQTIKIYRR